MPNIVYNRDYDSFQDDLSFARCRKNLNDSIELVGET
jgi:hypothetical protein